jgi:F-type H+-transporting ATPase subunit c
MAVGSEVVSFFAQLAEVTLGGGLVGLAAGFGVGLVVFGAGFGISRIASAAVESIARQPQASGDIRGAMLLTAALIEGVALFGAVICMMVQGNINPTQ